MIIWMCDGHIVWNMAYVIPYVWPFVFVVCFCVHSLFNTFCTVFNICIYMWVHVYICVYMWSCGTMCTHVSHATHFVCFCTSYMFFDAAMNAQCICMSICVLISIFIPSVVSVYMGQCLLTLLILWVYRVLNL